MALVSRSLWSAVRSCGGKERVKYFLDLYKPNFISRKDLNSFAAKIHQLKTKYYLELLRQGAITLRPGVKRLIEEAREKDIKMAIATTSSLPNVIALLEKYLDLDWFEVIAAGDIVAAKKPAPDIYKYVLSKMQIPAKNFLVFEDSDNGLVAAKATGLKTIVTINNYTQDQDFSQADLVISDLGEADKHCQVIHGDFSENYINISALREMMLIP